MHTSMIRRLRAPSLVAAALLSASTFTAGACAQTPARETAAASADLFAYDRNAPLEARDSLLRTEEGVQVRAVSFASPRGGRVTGRLWVPAGASRAPGVVLMHGAPGNAEQMGRHGLRMAKAGAVVVAIDAPWARRNAMPDFTPADSADQVALMVELQRAVDLLRARRDVDPARIAYVGASYGGAMGALFAGIERRLKGYALLVADGGMVSHFTGADDEGTGPRADMPAERWERWVAAMSPIEPIRWVGRANAPLLFLSGRTDRLVPAADAETLHRAAPEPKTVKWYDAGHGLNEQARADLMAWLHQTIGTAAEG